MDIREARPAKVSWAGTVRVWPTTRGLNLDELEAGRDLVLVCAPRHTGTVAPGVLLDDHLTGEDRAVIDATATSKQSAWTRGRGREFEFDGLSLAYVWEVELLADVFQPLARSVVGLSRVAARDSIRHVTLQGFHERMRATLAEVLAPDGVTVTFDGPPDAAPVYPSELGNPWQVPVWRRLLRSLIANIPIPSIVRGDILVVPYWHLLPVIDALPSAGLRPLFNLGAPPPTSRHRQVALLLRGGWISHPTRRQRRHSRRSLRARLVAARVPAPGDGFTRLLDEEALSLLAQRAMGTEAEFRTAVSAMSGGRVRAILLAFDSPASPRVLVQAARTIGIPSIVVQHGFFAEPRDPDKAASDVAIVWSDGECRRLAAERTHGQIAVCGNTGVERPSSAPSRAPADGHALLLVEYASRQTAEIPERIRFAHVRAGLEGLAAALPDVTVVIRPHPADEAPESYRSLTGIKRHVAIDAESRIEDLIAGSRLCVGAVSTATLQAALAGVPTVVLNVADTPRLPPFDGNSGLPVARSSSDLAQWLGTVPAVCDDASRMAAAQALGVRADALSATLQVIVGAAEPDNRGRPGLADRPC